MRPVSDTQNPSPSGPRWVIVAFICSSDCLRFDGTSVPFETNNPAIPHMVQVCIKLSDLSSGECDKQAKENPPTEASFLYSKSADVYQVLNALVTKLPGTVIKATCGALDGA